MPMVQAKPRSGYVSCPVCETLSQSQRSLKDSAIYAILKKHVTLFGATEQPTEHPKPYLGQGLIKVGLTFACDAGHTFVVTFSTERGRNTRNVEHPTTKQKP